MSYEEKYNKLIDCYAQTIIENESYVKWNPNVNNVNLNFIIKSIHKNLLIDILSKLDDFEISHWTLQYWFCLSCRNYSIFKIFAEKYRVVTCENLFRHCSYKVFKFLIKNYRRNILSTTIRFVIYNPDIKVFELAIRAKLFRHVNKHCTMDYFCEDRLLHLYTDRTMKHDEKLKRIYMVIESNVYNFKPEKFIPHIQKFYPLNLRQIVLNCYTKRYLKYYFCNDIAGYIMKFY